MADNTEWCQNPRCPEKKNSNQIRGTKGKKFYQSNKARGYGNGNFCTLSCEYQWGEKCMDSAIDGTLRNVRIVEAVKLPMESAWSKSYKWEYNNGDSHSLHYIENKLMGIKILITEQQYNSIGYSNDECMALASTLQSKQSA